MGWTGERILKAHPEAAWSGLAVGYALEALAEGLSHGAENVLSAVEAYASDEMDLVRQGAHACPPGNGFSTFAY